MEVAERGAEISVHLNALSSTCSASLLRENCVNLFFLSINDNIGEEVFDVNDRASFMLEMEGDVMSLSSQRNGPIMSGETLPKFLDERSNDCLGAERDQER